MKQLQRSHFFKSGDCHETGSLAFRLVGHAGLHKKVTLTTQMNEEMLPMFEAPQNRLSDDTQFQMLQLMLIEASGHL